MKYNSKMPQRETWKISKFNFNKDVVPRIDNTRMINKDNILRYTISLYLCTYVICHRHRHAF